MGKFRQTFSVQYQKPCLVVPDDDFDPEEVMAECRRIGAIRDEDPDGPEFVAMLRPEAGAELWTERALRKSTKRRVPIIDDVVEPIARGTTSELLRQMANQAGVAEPIIESAMTEGLDVGQAIGHLVGTMDAHRQAKMLALIKLLIVQTQAETFRVSQSYVRDWLEKAQAQLEAIICVKEPDRGVVLLSNDGPTHWDEGAKCQVYDHENFSPLGDALIALHDSLGGLKHFFALDQ